jgi:hypothetical protein
MEAPAEGHTAIFQKTGIVMIFFLETALKADVGFCLIVFRVVNWGVFWFLV